MESIYLDNNASTPLDPAVAQIVVEHMNGVSGNASSPHAFGRRAKALLTNSRHTIAELLGVLPEEIIFTSGASEAAAMLIKGFFDGRWDGHIITSSVEHSCVFKNVTYLEERGCQATYLDVGGYGAPTPEAVKEAIRPDTRLICLMAVNNETGVMTDIASIAEIAYQAGIPLFVDAVAAFGKIAPPLHRGVTAFFISGHKIHAPKGAGLAFVRKKLSLVPMIVGGMHEYGRRAGTENIPSIAGLAKAIELINLNEAKSIELLRDNFEAQLKDLLPELEINGEGPRICNCSCLAFPGIDGELLVSQLDRSGIAAGHGSACSSGAIEPSRVLRRMGLSKERASSSLRFSLSRFTTTEEINRAVEAISKVVNQQKQLLRGSVKTPANT